MKTAFGTAIATAVVLTQAVFAHSQQPASPQEPAADQKRSLPDVEKLNAAVEELLNSRKPLGGGCIDMESLATRELMLDKGLLAARELMFLLTTSKKFSEKAATYRRMAVERLQRIVKDYPDTPEAKEAAKLLASDLTATTVGQDGVGASSSQAAETAGKPIAVTAAKLIEAYDRNEREADELYLGKHLKVTGVVAGMRRHYDGRVQMDLKESSKRGLVQCLFDFSDERRLGIQIGDKVTVAGQCDGKHGEVVLIQCEVVQ
jgi:hypothetical protein